MFAAEFDHRLIKGKAMLAKSKKWIPGVLLTASLALPLNVQAGATTESWDWNFNGSGGTYSSVPSGGPDLNVTGYSSSNDVSGEDTIATRSLVWSGSSYGLHVDGEAGHGIAGDVGSSSSDNGWEDMESVLFGWGGQKVTLTEVEIGWYSNNYNFTLMEYTGSGSPSLTGLTYTQVAASSSWDLVGSYVSPSITGSTTAGATVDLTTLGWDLQPASYYLLSVSNPLLDPAATGPGYKWKNGYKYYDGFKLLGVAGTTMTPDNGGEIPVPATAFLFALGLPLLRVWRKKS